MMQLCDLCSSVICENTVGHGIEVGGQGGGLRKSWRARARQCAHTAPVAFSQNLAYALLEQKI